jgi:hypothetical protein
MPFTADDVTGLLYTGIGIGAAGLALGMVNNLVKQTQESTSGYNYKPKTKKKKTKYCNICKKLVSLSHVHKPMKAKK